VAATENPVYAFDFKGFLLTPRRILGTVKAYRVHLILKGFATRHDQVGIDP
jgi:hypothetical protein